MNMIWWLIPILAIPLWILQNIIHESSHATILWAYSHKTTIIPFPHRYTKVDGERVFYYPWNKEFYNKDNGHLRLAGVYSIRTEHSTDLPDTAQSTMLGMPWMVSYFLALIGCTLAYGLEAPWLVTIFMMLVIYNCVDMCFNRWSLFRKDKKNSPDWKDYNNDWWRIHKLEKGKLWHSRLLALGNTLPPVILTILTFIAKVIS